MKFTIREIKDGIATVDFDDGAWAEVPMDPNESEGEFIEKASAYATKKFAAPAWSNPEASIDGFTVERSIVSPEAVVDYPIKDAPLISQALENRIAAYGSATSQLEFITENGLEAWQEEVAEIKATHPKE